MRDTDTLPPHACEELPGDAPARPNTPALARTVATLRRIHLWLGVLLTPFLLLIAITGTVINHFDGGTLKKLHCGRQFGSLGRVTIDLVAVGLIVLAISGLALWIGPRISKARKHRHREK